MVIGNKQFHCENEVYMMGILNCTPDSFSDGGHYNTVDTALHHAQQMIIEGADIIDIGGESTKPGYQKISDEEEIERVVPIIEKIKSRFDIPISLDTYKSKVAEAGIEAGADMINDIWGLQYDDKMGEVIRKGNAACCLMHNRNHTEYYSLLQEVSEELAACCDKAVKCGIAEEKIIIDPGIGFGKTTEQNLQILQNLEMFRHLGYPILVGASRKSVIGNTLMLPVNERLEGTIAISVICAMKGCGILRVHDVAANKRAVQMTRAIMHA